MKKADSKISISPKNRAAQTEYTLREDSSTSARASNLEAQLAALYGESLWGEWSDPGALFEHEDVQNLRSSGSFWLRLMGIGIVVGLGAGLWWVVSVGMARSHGEERARVADEISEFLKVGDFDHIQQFLPRLQLDDKEWDPADPHLDLIIRAEATLYRYFDADPRRFDKIVPYLGGGDKNNSYHRVVSRALIASLAERNSHLESLLRVNQPGIRDPEASFLIATVFDRAGDIKKATKAFNHAEDLGPDHLFHLAVAAAFHIRHKKKQPSLRLMGQMIDKNPRSPWTRLTEIRCGLATGKPTQSLKKADVSFSPVLAGEWYLTRAISELNSKNNKAARQSLQHALNAVHHQAPFLLDYYERLMDESFPLAARFIMSIMEDEGWPK